MRSRGRNLRFETEQAAFAYARDLSMRWCAVRHIRVVESDDPVNYCYVGGKLEAVQIMKLETKLRGALRWAIMRCEKKRQPPPQITLAFLLKQWKRQRGRCALTRVPMEMSSPFGVTIDRVDSSRGYLRNNVVLATRFANSAKGDITVRQFRARLRQIWEAMP